jgi:glycosyltransferase involved in cell wall biosynthesis
VPALKKDLKILQVTETLDPGGAEKVVLDITNLLSKSGVRADVLTISRTGSFANQLRREIKIYNLRRKSKFNPLKIIEFAFIASKYDIIHVHQRHTLKYIWLINKITGLNKPIVFHDHYGDILINRTVDSLLSRAIKSVTYIGVSRNLTDWAIEDAGANPGKVFLLSNIIIPDEEAFAKRITNTENLKMVLVSNFRRTKNIEFAVDLAIYLAAHRHVSLDIYGQPNQKDYFDEISTRIEKSGAGHYIRIITDCYNVQSQLNKYDFAIHTAKSESGPLVLIEYLSHNLPFLSYDTGEVAYQMKTRLPLSFIDNFHLDDWAQRMNIILQNLDSMRDNYRQVYDEYYSPEIYLNKCLQIYEGITGTSTD